MNRIILDKYYLFQEGGLIALDEFPTTIDAHDLLIHVVPTNNGTDISCIETTIVSNGEIDTMFTYPINVNSRIKNPCVTLLCSITSRVTKLNEFIIGLALHASFMLLALHNYIPKSVMYNTDVDVINVLQDVSVQSLLYTEYQLKKPTVVVELNLHEDVLVYYYSFVDKYYRMFVNNTKNINYSLLKEMEVHELHKELDDALDEINNKLRDGLDEIDDGVRHVEDVGLKLLAQFRAAIEEELASFEQRLDTLVQQKVDEAVQRSVEPRLQQIERRMDDVDHKLSLILKLLNMRQ